MTSYMTPRTDIDWLDITESPDSWPASAAASRYHHLPVGRDRLNTLLERMPQVDDMVVWHGLVFRVVAMEGFRIARVAITRESDGVTVGD